MGDATKQVVSRAAKLAGQRLRELREKRGLTVIEVEKATGINGSNVARYERGEGETALRRYELLARFYGVAVSSLFASRRKPQDSHPQQ